MSRPKGSIGPGPDGSYFSAELPSDMLGQEPAEVLSGLDPIQIATDGNNFSGIDLSGFDMDVLGLDLTFFSSLDTSLLDPGVLDAIPVDGIGDVAGGIADATAEVGSSFLDVLSDIFSGLI